MQWFYADANRQPQGPVPFEKLKELQVQGVLQEDCFVIEEGSTDWKKLGEVLAQASSGAESRGATAAPVEEVIGKEAPSPVRTLALRMDSLALSGFIFGILSLPAFCCCYGLPLSLPAFICSLLSLYRIKKDPTLGGRHFAIAGLLLALTSFLLGILFVVFYGDMMASEEFWSEFNHEFEKVMQETQHEAEPASP